MTGADAFDFEKRDRVSMWMKMSTYIVVITTQVNIYIRFASFYSIIHYCVCVCVCECILLFVACFLFEMEIVAS